MKKSLSFLVVISLLFCLTGCQEKTGHTAGNSKGLSSTEHADLKLASVAKFLCSDGSWYLTEQKHEIFTGQKTIKLTAKEPFGEMVWSQSSSPSVDKKKAGISIFDKDLFRLMTDKSISRGLLELYLAGLEPDADLGRTGFMVNRELTEFVFEGRVYEPFFSDDSGIELYKDKLTGRKDLAVLRGKKQYVLYGYNYLKIENDRHFPSKIDIYIYNDKSDRKLIAQYINRLL